MKARVSSPAITDGQPAPDSEAATLEDVYLGRQPILDRSGALNAFELLFRSGAANLA
ncbi:hypothetical protein [Paraburkholderia sp. GAS32]|uniref:hypothetical protein n=1 Tax=Paraburkholderia sp. GAS32 TaxID=3035129 RepID=UPI003D1A79AA